MAADGHLGMTALWRVILASAGLSGYYYYYSYRNHRNQEHALRWSELQVNVIRYSAADQTM